MKLILPTLLTVLLLAGCLESNPQPSPGNKDQGGNYNGGQDTQLADDDALPPPGLDTLDPYIDSVVGGDISEPGEDAVTDQVSDLPEPMDTFETWDSMEIWDIPDVFETWDIPDIPDLPEVDAPPHADTAIAGGGSSFGMCWGPCKTDLTLDGADAHVVTSGWDDTIFSDNTGILTADGIAQSKSVAAALIGIALQDVYGCPDCADGGAKTIALLREGVASSHAYEFGSVPPALEDADAFVFQVISDLLTCTAGTWVTPDPGCVPAG